MDQDQQTEQLKEKEIEKSFLNIHIQFPDNSTGIERKKKLTQIAGKLKLFIVPSHVEFILNEKKWIGFSYLLSKVTTQRFFDYFSLFKCEIRANILSNSEHQEYIIEPVSIPKDGTDEIIVQEEESLIKDLEGLTKRVQYERKDLFEIAKLLVDKASTIKEKSYLIHTLPNPEDQKIELSNILTDFNQFVNHCYAYARSKSIEPIILFNKFKLPEYDRFNFTTNHFNQIVNITGIINSEPNLQYQMQKNNQLAMTQSFWIEDCNNTRLFVKALSNFEYISNIGLTFRAKVHLTGLLTIQNKTPYVQLYAINVLEKGSDCIEYQFKTTKRVIFSYVNENTGIFIRGHNRDSLELEYEAKLTEKPIHLEKIYINSDDQELFQIKFNNIGFEGTIKEIVERMKSGDQNCVVQEDQFSDAIRNLTRALVKEQKLVPEKVYSYVGVHLDEQKNLVLVIPQLAKIIPTNPIQKNCSDLIEKANIYLPKVNEIYSESEKDEIHSFLQHWYNVFEFAGTQKIHKITEYSFWAISPFYKSLSRSKRLDVFPANISIGVPGSGKTTLAKLFRVNFYGLEIDQGNTFDSASRAKDLMSGSTIPPVIDEMDSFAKNPAVVNFIKSALTSMNPTGRKTSGQDWIWTEMTSTFKGTANRVEFLEVESAFKEGRVQLTTYKKRTNLAYKPSWDRLESEIVKSKILGYFFLQEAIRFIRNYRITLPKELGIDNDLDAMIHFIERKKSQISKILEKYKIQLSDTRRLSINALLLAGLEIWQFVFFSYGFISDTLNSFIQEDSKELAEFIKDFEEQNRNQKLEDINSVMAFIQEKFKNKSNEEYLLVDRTDETIWINKNFIALYNGYARNAGFRTFKDLPSLGEILSNLLPHKDAIEAKLKRFRTGASQIRAIPIYFKDLYNDKVPDEIIAKQEPDQQTLEFHGDDSLKSNLRKRMEKEIRKLWLGQQIAFEDVYTKFSADPLVTDTFIREFVEDLEKSKKAERIDKTSFRLLE